MVETIEDKKKEEEEQGPIWSLWTAGSYAFVMLLIGLPLWWKTTAVQRVPLPYHDMATLKDQIGSDQFEIKVPLRLVGFSKVEEGKEEGKEKSLNGLRFSVAFEGASAPEMDALYKTETLYETDRELCQLNNATRSNNIYYVGRADLLKQYGGQRIVLGNCRNFYFISNSSKIKNLEWVWKVMTRIGGGEIHNEKALANPNDNTNNEEVTLSLPLSAGYNILLSLMVPEPEVLDSKWNIEEAVKQYLNPMLQKLYAFADFSVRSQVLYYTRLNVFPTYNSEKQYYEIPYAQLPLVINPVESKLTSFVSQNPVLNFLTYTSPCGKYPMQIIDKDGYPLETNAFLVPQWGGIFIYNPFDCGNLPKEGENSTSSQSPNSKVHQVSVEQIMSVVISQFRSLIGLSEDETSSSSEDDAILTLDFRGSALREWEVDALLRTRLKRLLSTASNTLHSLGKLLDEITNIVVTEEVGEQVEKSVSSIKLAIEEASSSSLEEAQNHAIQAYKSSEIAFHHPKNLKQLYFPDDQKYAIYIPLFLPVGIPVLLSLRVIVKRILDSRKGK